MVFSNTAPMGVAVRLWRRRAHAGGKLWISSATWASKRKPKKAKAPARISNEPTAATARAQPRDRRSRRASTRATASKNTAARIAPNNSSSTLRSRQAARAPTTTASTISTLRMKSASWVRSLIRPAGSLGVQPERE